MAGLPFSARPFRIWNEGAKHPLPHRCYAEKARAIEKALVLAYRDLEVGNAYTVYDDRSGHVVRQFTKRLESNKVKILELE